MTKWEEYKIHKKPDVLFKIVPTKEWVCKFLEDVYGIKDWNGNKIINRINGANITDKLIDYLPSLSIYMYNHFINTYFYNPNHELDFRKTITLLHHFTNLYGYNICYSNTILYNNNSKPEKIINYKIYNYKENNPFLGIKITKNVIIFFD